MQEGGHVTGSDRNSLRRRLLLLLPSAGTDAVDSAVFARSDLWSGVVLKVFSPLSFRPPR